MVQIWVIYSWFAWALARAPAKAREINPGDGSSIRSKTICQVALLPVFLRNVFRCVDFVLQKKSAVFVKKFLCDSDFLTERDNHKTK